MRIRIQPNPTWVVCLILAICWFTNLLNGWIAIFIFIIYCAGVYFLMARDSSVKKDAEEFAKKVALDQENKKRKQLQKTLENSVKIERK